MADDTGDISYADFTTSLSVGTRPLYSALNSESLEAGIQALAAEFVFNLQQAVVFSNAFTAVRSAGFDLCRIQGTARSAMDVSSVSPERWETIAR